MRFGGRAIALGVGFLSAGSRGADACFLEGLLGSTSGLECETCLVESCWVEEVRVEEDQAWDRHVDESQFWR